MMKQRLFLLLGIFLPSLIHPQASQTDFSGGIFSQAGLALPNSGQEGDFLTGESQTQCSLSLSSGESRAFIDGSISFDALKAQAAGQRADFVSGDSALSLQLKEAWADWDGGFWAVRIGRQISAWGQADGLQVTDILCPKDETSLIARDYADSRLGIDAARLSLKSQRFLVDAYWIPFFTPSSLPLTEGNPLKKVLFPREVLAGKQLIPVNDIGGENLLLPQQKITSSEGAVKISAYLPMADFSLYGFYGYEREPLLLYQLEKDEEGRPESLSLYGDYERLLMVGADTAIPVKELLLRLEAAFFPSRHFSADFANQVFYGEKTVRQNQLLALAGLDWMPSGWTITAQYYADYIFSKSDKVERKAYLHQASLSLSKSFLQESLKLSLSGVLGLNEFDSMVSGDISYSLSDLITLTIGADIFSKGQDGEKGFYGAYKDLSCAYLKAQCKW